MSVDNFEGRPTFARNSGPAHKSYSYSMPRSMSANTLLSEVVWAVSFALRHLTQWSLDCLLAAQHLCG